MASSTSSSSSPSSSSSSMPRLGALAAAAVAALVWSASPASAQQSGLPPFDLYGENSFQPPFNHFDGEGMRDVPSWSLGGTGLDLNENFIRLTPDRASKRGYVWNRAKLDKDAWSATIRFRVSGQGKRMFGDGLAVFFTTHNGYREGPLHGFADVFTGFGVVFDTYVNTDPGHIHKDILVVSNDGTGSKAAPHGGSNDPNPQGCDGDFSEFRYWEGRDDFSVFNHSAARIVFRDNKVSVYIDARATGQWSSCVMDVPVAAPFGWHREGGWLGIIATTGDLADNHDVLSVQVGAWDQYPPNPFDASQGGSIWVPNVAPIVTGNMGLDTQLNAFMQRNNAAVGDRLNFIQHHLEHQLAALNDGVKATLRKLGEAEESNKKRIDELEKRLASTLDAKVASTVEGNIADRLAKLEAQVGDKLKNDILPQIQESVTSGSRSWLIPFSILLLVLIVGFIYGFRNIRWLIKRETGLDLGMGGFSPSKKR